MTQEDIDKLIICRAAIDKHREFNRWRARCLEITPAEYLKDARELIEIDRTADTITINEFMVGHEFVDEEGNGSVSSFMEWQDSVCLQVFKECVVLSSDTCDFCDGYEKEAPCLVLFKDSSCYVTKPPNGESRKDSTWRFFFGRSRTFGNIRDSLVCPAGHGFQIDYDNTKEFPFDLFWS